MTNTGLSSHALARLCSSRLARIQSPDHQDHQSGRPDPPQRIHHGVRGHEH